MRALILTGQRRSEVAEARWSELDAGTDCLVISAERMKNRRAHAVPLTKQMHELLDGLPRFDGCDFIFSATGSTPVVGFGTFKAAFDRAVAAIEPVEPWQIHDLRRTARTGLSRAGVAPFDAELVVAHVQGGVHGVYDLFRYDGEKRSALERWEQLLTRIIDPDPGNVVSLLARAAR